MELTRRELVAAFLGAAVAQACSPRVRAPVPGRLVDAGLIASAHRLRPAGAPPPLAAEAEAVDALVVGGGVAGLAAGWRLAAAGVRSLRVLELDTSPGGTARGGANAVSAFPWGAHYVPAPLEAAGPVVRLLAEAGALERVEADGRAVWREEVLVREPEERLFYRGTWYEGLYLRAGASAQDLAELARFERAMAAFAGATDAKGRRAFAVPVDASSQDAEWTGLDRLSMAEWLTLEGFRSPRLLWMVDYACRDDYGALASGTSAWAGIWYFAARRGRHGEKGPGFLTWPEGNGRLVATLARALPHGTLLSGTVAHTLTPLPGRAGWRVDALGPDGAPRAWHARQVVLACPRFVAARLVAPWRTARPAFLDAFHYAPWTVANVTVRAPPAGHGAPLAWDNVPYESASLGYVVATHQRPRAWDGGPTVLTWYLPFTGEDVAHERARMLAADYGAWEQLVTSDLALAHPELLADVEQLEVQRWGHAMVRPRPGFLWGGARAAAARPLDGTLHFAHTDLGGMALFEEALHHGVRAAEDTLGGLGRAAASWR